MQSEHEGLCTEVYTVINVTESKAKQSYTEIRSTVEVTIRAFSIVECK